MKQGNRLNAGIDRAVFLDRDGTINEDSGFVSSVKDFRLLEGAAEGIRFLKKKGFRVIVLTNQSGIARGYLSESTLKRIHDKMNRQLEDLGAGVDALYYCPHHPTVGEKKYRRRCDCRKPRDGLFRKAIEDFGLDPRKCFAVGDSPRDIVPAKRLGCKTVFLSDRPLSAVAKKLGFKPNKKCATLLEAAQWIGRQNRVRSASIG